MTRFVKNSGTSKSSMMKVYISRMRRTLNFLIKLPRKSKSVGISKQYPVRERSSFRPWTMAINWSGNSIPWA
jgi:hypothetical protein